METIIVTGLLLMVSIKLVLAYVCLVKYSNEKDRQNNSLGKCDQ